MNKNICKNYNLDFGITVVYINIKRQYLLLHIYPYSPSYIDPYVERWDAQGLQPGTTNVQPLGLLPRPRDEQAVKHPKQLDGT